MNGHVRDHLAAWIGGDAEEGRARAIEAHLATCEACRDEAETLRQTQSWLKDALELPFETEDREALRRAVLARVSSGSRTRRPLLLWVGAASLAAASILLLALRRGPAPTVSVPTPAPKISTGESPSAVPSPAHPMRTARVRPGPVPRSTPRVVAEPARIEIQTANPTIRIIWLARAAQAEPATHPDPEAS